MEVLGTQMKKTTPKDVFMHLLGFVAMYVSIVSFITLVFQYISVLFPDALNFYYSGILNQIRWSASVLIIVFPVYLLVSWLLEKDFSKNPEKRELRFRKWLVYFTLFVAAVTVIIDLITLVYNFYSGELTIKFFLDILTVLVVAAGVFGYYFWDLKRAPGEKSPKPRLIAWVVSLVILAGIIASFIIVGSPATQRLRRFDEDRINALQTLQNEIVNYWIQKANLPSTLNDLKNSITGFLPPLDPETNTSYEYNLLEPLSFELCAVFKTTGENPRTDTMKPVPAYPAGGGDFYQQNWSHGKGRVCFKRTIDPELYKNEQRPPVKY